MRTSLLTFVAVLSGAAWAQNCGPQYGSQVCAQGLCCSQYGWCDITPAHCDPATCQKAFSGAGSSCAGTGGATTTLRTSTSAVFPTGVPVIDTCGPGASTCPGVGPNGYFYRCCSAAGHCGPKNDIQDQALYCGSGCQPGVGKCNTMAVPVTNPNAQTGTAGAGEPCGPLVNKKCGSGLCCSGSNFCGTTADFCGAANWCQPKWGKCS